MKQKEMIIAGGIVVLVGAGAFFGGMKYQQSKSPIGMMNGRGGAMFMQSANGGRMAVGMGSNRKTTGFTPVMGEIISQDGESVTVKLQDGSSKIVNISSSTKFSKTDEGTKEDLAAGTQVAAFGTTNSDGSVTAENIQINPMFSINRNMKTTPTPAK